MLPAMINWMVIFLGGGLGSLCRYGISKLVIRFGEFNFPVATLVSNALSCIVLALSVTFILPKTNDGSWLRGFLLIGFCGGFSTFSTFSMETLELLKTGNYVFAFANIIISVLACIALLALILKNG